jgi:hypothetical protein
MHDEWSKRTASGLPILKKSVHPWYVRFNCCDDPGLFTVENDHNPLVVATCPDCKGAGRWCHDDPETGTHYYCQCPRCNGSGVIDQPARLFDNDKPPEVIRVSPDGWTRCPNCRVHFCISDRAAWTGWRHSCGQRLTIRQENESART